MMRTSPCWMHTCHVLPQATSRLQLSRHIRFGFSHQAFTVLVISPSYDIETGHIRMCWKWDDDAVILVLVLAPEGSWVMLCDHDKVLRHFFGPNWPCIRVGPSAQVVDALLDAPQPQVAPLGYKFSRAAAVQTRVLLIGCDFRQGSNFLHSYCTVEVFCCESGPPFLFVTTVSISPFVIRT